MMSFLRYIAEEAETKLKHIHHAEDRPLLHFKRGFDHAVGALKRAHEHMKAGKTSSNLTMKYDGSPSIVFGHHPKTGKFFVASKSAFNKNPKINYTEEDIERNHGHAPGLVEKLKHALQHLPKVAPKKGVYQGDVMFSGNDVKSKGDKASFTPNTITYTAGGEAAKKIKRAKVGVVVHTKYTGSNLETMKATPNVDSKSFGSHPDVYHHSAEYDTSKISYPKEAQKEFEGHLAAAKAIHYKHGISHHDELNMYSATARHAGEGGHLATYINSTVRSGETPSVEGFRKHIAGHFEKAAGKLKTPAKAQAKRVEAAEHDKHIQANSKHYANLLQMHGHLQAAKNVLVKHLEQNKGGYEHSINGKPSQPEGFVVNHKGEPTKLVNRAEFARQNLLKTRGNIQEHIVKVKGGWRLVSKKTGRNLGTFSSRAGAENRERQVQYFKHIGEESEKHSVITFGRMNPPTSGHEQVVKKVKQLAKQYNAHHAVILSHSQDSKKNPLSLESKLKHARNAFSNTNIVGASAEKPTILHHAADLHKAGIQHLHVVVGSDRMEEMKNLLNKYNGKKSGHGLYNFKSINIHSAGARDPDAEGITGISGSKMRALAAAGKKSEFYSGLPSKMKSEHKADLYNDLRGSI